MGMCRLGSWVWDVLVSGWYVLTDNTKQNYLEEGEVDAGVPAVAESLQVTALIATDFLVLIGIFFPSVTGTFSTCW